MLFQYPTAGGAVAARDDGGGGWGCPRGDLAGTGLVSPADDEAAEEDDGGDEAEAAAPPDAPRTMVPERLRLGDMLCTAQWDWGIAETPAMPFLEREADRCFLLGAAASLLLLLLAMALVVMMGVMSVGTSCSGRADSVGDLDRLLLCLWLWW